MDEATNREHTDKLCNALERLAARATELAYRLGPMGEKLCEEDAFLVRAAILPDVRERVDSGIARFIVSGNINDMANGFDAAAEFALDTLNAGRR